MQMEKLYTSPKKVYTEERCINENKHSYPEEREERVKTRIEFGLYDSHANFLKVG